MIKFSKLADYAVVVLSALHHNEGIMMSASELSQGTRLPEPTVAKVLKLLAKGNLVTSVRGAQGGYKVAHDASALKIADIVIAVDGPVSLTACVESGTNDCEYSCSCPVKGRWDLVNNAVKSALESITLADMIARPILEGNEKTLKTERVS